jgi:hypothetical protein
VSRAPPHMLSRTATLTAFVLAAVLPRSRTLAPLAYLNPHPPFSWSTYTSAKFGYLRSACSSRCSIHAFKNFDPLP